MFRFGVLLLTIFLVVASAQNVLGDGNNGTQAVAPNRVASFISIVPIDELTTTTTTTSASVMNRGAQKVRNGTTSIEESLATTTTTLAPALNLSSKISGESSTTVQVCFGFNSWSDFNSSFNFCRIHHKFCNLVVRRPSLWRGRCSMGMESL